MIKAGFLASLFILTIFSSPAYSAVAECKPEHWEGIYYVRGVVHHTVDGDTVNVLIKDKQYSVRMLGIDTAETNYQGKSQGYWGDKAKARLQELLPEGAAVRLEFEEEKCDRYGRMLSFVWVGKSNINKKMLSEALAVNYCIFPSTHCEELATVVRRNVKARRGIFGDPNFELPYEWRRKESGRPHEKYVGNIQTFKVYPPGSLDRIPIADRVFFMDERDIKKPFRLVSAQEASELDDGREVSPPGEWQPW